MPGWALFGGLGCRFRSFCLPFKNENVKSAEKEKKVLEEILEEKLCG